MTDEKKIERLEAKLAIAMRSLVLIVSLGDNKQTYDPYDEDGVPKSEGNSTDCVEDGRRAGENDAYIETSGIAQRAMREMGKV